MGFARFVSRRLNLIALLLSFQVSYLSEGASAGLIHTYPSELAKRELPPVGERNGETPITSENIQEWMKENRDGFDVVINAAKPGTSAWEEVQRDIVRFTTYNDRYLDIRGLQGPEFAQTFGQVDLDKPSAEELKAITSGMAEASEGTYRVALPRGAGRQLFDPNGPFALNALPILFRKQRNGGPAEQIYYLSPGATEPDMTQVRQKGNSAKSYRRLPPWWTKKVKIHGHSRPFYRGPHRDEGLWRNGKYYDPDGHVSRNQQEPPAPLPPPGELGHVKGLHTYPDDPRVWRDGVWWNVEPSTMDANLHITSKAKWQRPIPPHAIRGAKDVYKFANDVRVLILEGGYYAEHDPSGSGPTTTVYHETEYQGEPGTNRRYLARPRPILRPAARPNTRPASRPNGVPENAPGVRTQQGPSETPEGPPGPQPIANGARRPQRPGSHALPPPAPRTDIGKRAVDMVA